MPVLQDSAGHAGKKQKSWPPSAPQWHKFRNYIINRFTIFSKNRFNMNSRAGVEGSIYQRSYRSARLTGGMSENGRDIGERGRVPPEMRTNWRL